MSVPSDQSMAGDEDGQGVAVGRASHGAGRPRLTKASGHVPIGPAGPVRNAPKFLPHSSVERPRRRVDRLDVELASFPAEVGGELPRGGVGIERPASPAHHLRESEREFASWPLQIDPKDPPVLVDDVKEAYGGGHGGQFEARHPPGRSGKARHRD
jgi:hypothetical protein